MGWIEQRLKAIEQRLEYLYRLFQQLQIQATNSRQQLTSAWQDSGGGGSSSAAFYVVMAPSSGTYTGTWSGSAPTAGSSFTGTVYQVQGTSTITSLGTQTCVNWIPATLVNSRACIVIPDGAGNYGVVSQSCT